MVVSTDGQESPVDYYQDRQTLSSGNLSTFGVVRKYMNGAVCVESAVDITNNDLLPRKENTYRKRVSCSCSSEHVCPVHEDVGSKEKLNENKSGTGEKVKKIIRSTNDMKLSIESLDSNNSGEENERLKEEFYKKWMLKKNEEKKRIEENKIYLQEIAEQEKEKRTLYERENFEKWLLNKKKEQERKRLDKERKIKKEKDKEEEKERRNLECKLKFELWLRKKEEAELEKKLKSQMDLIKKADVKQQRTQINEKAYQTWLERSKTKPKPIPLGRGLETLRSSVSVRYVNPIPWIPNIDQSKPASK